jgi:Tol biopolymer transport system component
MVKDSSYCVTDESHVRDYSWSPSGLLLAYDVGNGTIRLHNMTSGIDTAFPYEGYARDPTFGASSNTLYFSAATTQGDFIWNATIGGNRVKQLSWEGSDIEPSVSPSGNYLMYLTNLSGRYEPWIVNLATGINIYLLNRPDLGLSYVFPRAPLMANGTIPSWGPSGNNILFISNDNGSSGTLYLVTLDVTVDLSQVFTFPMSMVLGLNVYNEVPLGALVSDAQWSPTGNVVVETSVSGFQQLIVLENGPPVHVGYGG